MRNNDLQAPLSAVSDNPTDTPPVDSGTSQAEPNTDDQGQAKVDQEGNKGQAKSSGDSGQDKAPDQEPQTLEFFDPKSVPEELKPAYKNMQAAYTSKTQAVAKDRQKIQQYDNFMTDPMGTMSKMGYQLVPIGQNQQNQQNQQNPEQNMADFAPQSWDEVLDAVEQRLLPKIQSNMKPIIDSVQGITQKNIEKQLEEIDSNWKLYEDDMRDMLQKHPSLAQDVNLLYRSSVPEHVLSQKAVQAALKKIDGKVRGASVHGSGSPKTEIPEPQVSSFADAVKYAKNKLNSA